MATRMKAKRKGKAKRKKTLVSKVAARKKATTVRKTKAIRKKAPKRAPVRRVSSKKAKPAAKVAVEAAPASAPAEPEAVRPMPGLAAQPTPPAEPGERIGVVTHYYSHLSVAIMRLEVQVRCALAMLSISAGTPRISAKRLNPSRSIKLP